MKQTRYSGNTSWSNKLYRVRSGDSSPFPSAIELTYAEISGAHSLTMGDTVYIKWVQLTDEVPVLSIGLWFTAPGLSSSTPMTLTDCNIYNSAGSIIPRGIDAQTNASDNGPFGSFPTHEFFTGTVAEFIPGHTYYISFVAPVTGPYTFFVRLD
jgi:hypothetical protein